MTTKLEQLVAATKTTDLNAMNKVISEEQKKAGAERREYATLPETPFTYLHTPLGNILALDPEGYNAHIVEVGPHKNPQMHGYNEEQLRLMVTKPRRDDFETYKEFREARVVANAKRIKLFGEFALLEKVTFREQDVLVGISQYDAYFYKNLRRIQILDSNLNTVTYFEGVRPEEDLQRIVEERLPYEGIKPEDISYKTQN